MSLITFESMFHLILILLQLTLLYSSTPLVYIPGQKSLPFTIPLQNSNALSFTYTSPRDHTFLPLVIWVTNFEYDPWSAATFLSNYSIDMFLQSKFNMNNSTYLVIPKNHMSDITAFQQHMLSRSIAASMNPTIVFNSFLFSNVTFEELTSIAPSITGNLNEWTMSVHRLRITYSNDTEFIHSNKSTYNSTSQSIEFAFNISRLDCYWPNCDTSIPSSSAELFFGGDACEFSRLNNATGKLVLVTAQSCSYEYAAEVVSASGGAAALVIMNETESVSIQINAGGDIYIPVFTTSISYADGMRIKGILSSSDISASNGVRGYFYSTSIPGYSLLIDTEGKLQEIGSTMNADLRLGSWATQYEVYQQKLTQRLHREAAIQIPIFDQEIISSSAIVNIPRYVSEEYKSLHIETSITCPGNYDTGYGNCAQWDHTVSINAYCSAIQQDQLSQTQHDSSHRLLEVGGEPQEIARYVTPFSRRIGHWLTNISVFIPVILNGTFAQNESTLGGYSCYFKADAGGYPWFISSTLRFTDPSKPFKKGYLPLYSFRQYLGPTYNSNRTKLISLPKSSNRVLLEAIITGHGQDSVTGCCEFLPTSHIFTITRYDRDYEGDNGSSDTGVAASFNLTFSDAGTNWGCSDMAYAGSEPNEYGTWWYGRAGWCDGMDVKPWVVDISEVVSPSKDSAKSYSHTNRFTIDYKLLMLLGDRWEPPSRPQTGYIIMSSNLIYYRDHDSSDGTVNDGDSTEAAQNSNTIRSMNVLLILSATGFATLICTLSYAYFRRQQLKSRRNNSVIDSQNQERRKQLFVPRHAYKALDQGNSNRRGLISMLDVSDYSTENHSSVETRSLASATVSPFMYTIQ